jgi:hypothetical protein
MAGVALIAAVDAELRLSGSFSPWRGMAANPEKPFVISIIQRQ